VANQIQTAFDIFIAMKLMLYILFALTLWLLSGCYVESARPEKNTTLFIASDYLSAEDTVLFEDFCNQYKLRVEIQNIDVHDLIGAFRNERHNLKYDIVLMHSLFSVRLLNQQEMLHKVNHINSKNRIEAYSSNEYNYIGIGVNPFICFSNPDTSLVVRTYGDLQSNHFINSLSDEELVPMLAPIVAKLNKVEGYNWIKKFNKYSVDRKDAIFQSTPFHLTSWSKQKEIEEDSLLLHYSTVSYPNGNTSGTFYDLRTACIINQSSNYTQATNFINYYIQPKTNNKLNEQIRSIGIHESNKVFRPYKVHAEELLQYHEMVQRILTKLK
jgi:ABC-type thiamine transport system substrate-binding protein